jgi:HSP20 family protein
MLPNIFRNESDLFVTPRGLRSLQRDMDRFFESLMPESGRREAVRPEVPRNLVPQYDVKETEDHFVLSIDLPGIPKDAINIEVKDNYLVVDGERKAEKGKTHTERRFHAEFQLPESIDHDKIEASHEHGVLTLAVPKAAAAKPRRIQIGETGGFLGKLVKGEKEEKSERTEPAKKAV